MPEPKARPLFTLRTQLWGDEWARIEANTINVPANTLDDEGHVAIVDLGLTEATARIVHERLTDYLGLGDTGEGDDGDG